MPLVSPNEIVLPITNLIIIRTANNPNKIKTNDFDGIKYMSSCFISNFDDLIKNMENIIPTTNASRTCAHGTRNAGTTNINAPVLIKTGGKIIFLTDAGFFAAFNRTKIIKVAIHAATTVLAIIQNIQINSF